MNLLEIIFIAVALSMDAFAVSVTLGLSGERASAGKSQTIYFLLPGIYFGFFQALMPLLGYYAGALLASRIQTFDHWAAFILLAFIGGKMIKDSLSKDEKSDNEKTFGFVKMLLLAIATSIDALAVGVTFAFFERRIFTSIFIIGLTTFCISTAGVIIGNRFGAKHRSKAELAGGVILILIGLKILIEAVL